MPVNDLVPPEAAMGLMQSSPEDDGLAERVKGIEERTRRQKMIEELDKSGVGGQTLANAMRGQEANATIAKSAYKIPLHDTGIALWDLARQGGEFALDAGSALADMGFQEFAPLAAGLGSKAANDGVQKDTEQRAEKPVDSSAADLEDLFPEFINSVDKIRSKWGQGDNAGDVAIQKIIQFAAPWGVALKVFGGLEKTTSIPTALMNTAKMVGADAVSASLFDPHEARLADVMKSFSPDGYLLNKYIDYLASDPSDTDAEGRFKNVVDNFVLGTPLAALGEGFALTRAAWPEIKESLKEGATSLKEVRRATTEHLRGLEKAAD